MDKKRFKGTIISGVGGLYQVRPDFHAPNCPDELPEQVPCRARGAFRREGVTPLPGDRVEVEEASAGADTSGAGGTGDDVSGGGYVIDAVETRINSLCRPALANLTHLFAVIPAARPEPDLITADKLICLADSKNALEPVVVVTKKDAAEERAAALAGIYEKSGFTVFTVSSVTGEGVEELRDYIRSCSGKGPVIAAFAGASGAGKSTLMNRIFPGLSLAMGEVSRKISRGRHTTRASRLFCVPDIGDNCLIADTPGFSMLDFTRFNLLELEELASSFREFVPYLGFCRYRKCTHLCEDGCAVFEAVKAGKIPEQRHKSYVTIYGEISKNPKWKRKDLPTGM